MADKLRLLLTETCNRNCEGCCNKDWDLAELPVVDSFKGYSMVMLTGGEPMLDPLQVFHVVDEIRMYNFEATILLYTADLRLPLSALVLLEKMDGMTITLHEQSDVPRLNKFIGEVKDIAPTLFARRSMRLNVFKGIDISSVDTTNFKVKENIVWLEQCPLPEGEVFMRYSHA